jgi:hypothetical protein
VWAMMVNSKVRIPDHGWTWVDRTRPAAFARWRGLIGAIGTAPAGASRSAVGFSAGRGRRRWEMRLAGVPRTRKGMMVALTLLTSLSSPTAASVAPAPLMGSSLVVRGRHIFWSSCHDPSLYLGIGRRAASVDLSRTGLMYMY